MRTLPLVALAALTAGCGLPVPPADTAAEGAVRAIEQGVAPPDIEKTGHPRVLAALARRLAAGEPWKSPEDRARAARHLSANARPEDAALLYRFVREESGGLGYFAALGLSAVAGEEILARVEKDIDDAALRPKLLTLLAGSRHERARAVVERRAAAFLDPANPDAARAALSALGAHRVRSATPAVIDFYNGTDNEKLDHAALRVLGRIWEMGLDDRPSGEDDRLRLQAYLVAHMVSMSGAAGEESCWALLSLMTRRELEEFLGKHAGDKFASRWPFAVAARRESLDAAKGRMVHTALLSSPDRDLAAHLLLFSPHSLDAVTVARLLDVDERVAVEGLPSDLTLAECAAARLSGKRAVPPSTEERRKIVEEARKRRP